MMHDALHVNPGIKTEGLSAFCASGFLLVDATYTPVNKCPSDRERDKIILSDYSSLREDLFGLPSGRHAKILLIKANICRLLEPMLVADGFSVDNGGAVIPFPSNGQQGNFRRAIQVLREAGHKL